MAKAVKKPATKKNTPKARSQQQFSQAQAPQPQPQRPYADAVVTGEILDRLWTLVMNRRTADPAHSHSARLLSRGRSKVAQKFGEEAVECLIEAVAGNPEALIAESADVLYHLLVMWVAVGIEPSEVWAELARREGVSGVVEKARRSRTIAVGTTKIP